MGAFALGRSHRHALAVKGLNSRKSDSRFLIPSERKQANPDPLPVFPAAAARKRGDIAFSFRAPAPRPRAKSAGASALFPRAARKAAATRIQWTSASPPGLAGHEAGRQI